MNITVKSVLDISGAKETHVNSIFFFLFHPNFTTQLFFFFAAQNLYNQFHFFFLTINEATVMLCATMNEIKHCAG